MKPMQFFSCGVPFLLRILTSLKFALAMMIAVTLFPGSNASAQTAYWDTNGSTPGSSSGTTAAGLWDDSTTNWSTSSDGTAATQIWNPGDTAVISAGTNATGTYTITVSGTQAPGSIAFNVGDVTLDGGTLQTSSVSALSGASGTIASDLTGSGGLTKSGAGTVTLSGAASYTGDTTINGGTLAVDGASGAINATRIVDVGYSSTGILSVTDGGEITTSRGITLGYNSGISGTLNVNGIGSQVVASADFLTVGYFGTGELNITDGGNVTGLSWTVIGLGETGVGTGLVTGTGSQLTSVGYLRIGSIGQGMLTISNGGTVTASDGLTFGSSGGTGTLHLNEGGTLIVGGADGIRNSGAATFNLAGGILQGTSSALTSSVPITLTNASTIDTPSADITLSGVLSGPGSLIKSGNGSLNLSGSNTYSGGTVLEAGTLTLGNSNGLGASTSTLTINGGTLNLGSFSSTIGTAVFNGGSVTNGTLQGTNSFGVQAGSVDANLGGTAALTKTDTGTFILTGSNTYSGGTTVSAGTLQIGDGGTTGSIIGNISNSGTVVFERSDDIIFAGDISDFGSLTQNGSGRLTLSGANTYTGPTTVNDGTLALTDITNLGVGSLAVNTGGIFTVGNDFADTTSRTITVDGAGALFHGDGYLWFNRTSSTTTSIAITDGGAMTSATSISLADASNSTNALTVSGTDSALTASTILFLGYLGDATATVSDGGTITTGTLDLASQSLGSAEFNLNTGGTLAVSGGTNAIFTGDGSSTFNLGGGTLKVVGNNLTTAVPMTLVAATDSTIDTNNLDATLSGVLSGDGALSKAGDGTLLLTGTNTYTGGTTVDGGILQVAGASHLGSGNININAGGTFNATDDLEFDADRSVTVAGSAALLDADTHIWFGTAGGADTTATISDGATITVGTTFSLADVAGSTSTLLVTGSDSLLHSNGNLYVGYSGIATATVADGGTIRTDALFSLASTGGSTGTLNLNDGGTLQVGGTDGLAFGYSGTGTGAFNFNGGTLQVINSNLTTSVPMTLGDATASTVDTSGFDATLSGALSGNGALVKSGVGTLILSGSNTYTGGTTVSGGILQIGDGSTTGSITGNISNSGTLVFNRSDDSPYADVISGSGGLTKTGAGTLTLSGSNTYTGGTQITAGTLQAAFDDAVGTGTITVDGGIFLVDEGVTLSPTNTVTLSGGEYHREFAQNADLANGVNATSQFAGGAADTTVEILQSTLLANADTIQTSFADSSVALNDAIRISDVYSFQGTETGTDIFVLQLSMTGVGADSYLGWLNGSNQWVNAVEGNTSGMATFVPGAYTFADFHLGYYGVDTNTGSVWAVLNHNSDFSIVPEPSTLVLFGLAGLAFLRRRRIQT